MLKSENAKTGGEHAFVHLSPEAKKFGQLLDYFLNRRANDILWGTNWPNRSCEHVVKGCQQLRADVAVALRQKANELPRHFSWSRSATNLAAGQIKRK